MQVFRTPHVAQLVGDAGNVGSTPGSGRSLEEEMATHSSILAWRIPRTGYRLHTVHGVTKSWTQLSDNHTGPVLQPIKNVWHRNTPSQPLLVIIFLYACIKRGEECIYDPIHCRVPVYTFIYDLHIWVEQRSTNLRCIIMLDEMWVTFGLPSWRSQK